MLKLELAYKHSFPRDQDSGLKSSSNSCVADTENTTVEIVHLNFIVPT